MADKEDAALSGWGGLTTSSFEDSTFGQGHLLPSASTSRCAEEEEAVVNAPQPDTANDPCVDDELRQQWRRNKPGRKPETRNQQKQQQPRRSKQPTQPTQPKPTVARAARAVHHTHTARLRPSFEGGLPASPGVPVVDLDCQGKLFAHSTGDGRPSPEVACSAEVPRSDSDAQQQPCSPTVLRERVVVDRGYNPNVRPARADHAPGTHRMTSAAGQSDKQLPGVQNSRPAIHVVHGTGNVTHATPQTQQMPVETAHAESRPAENAEVLKLRRFLAAIEVRMRKPRDKETETGRADSDSYSCGPPVKLSGSYFDSLMRDRALNRSQRWLCMQRRCSVLALGWASMAASIGGCGKVTHTTARWPIWLHFRRGCYTHSHGFIANSTAFELILWAVPRVAECCSADSQVGAHGAARGQDVCRGSGHPPRSWLCSLGNTRVHRGGPAAEARFGSYGPWRRAFAATRSRCQRGRIKLGDG